VQPEHQRQFDGQATHDKTPLVLQAPYPTLHCWLPVPSDNCPLLPTTQEIELAGHATQAPA